MRLTLEEWAKREYATPPHIQTLRRWARDARIYPLPQKHGRTYLVEENARYVGNYNSADFMGRVSDAAQAQ